MASDSRTGSSPPRHSNPRPYSVSSLPLFGVEVRGIDLKAKIDPETVAMVKEDVAEYRLMVFRDQGLVSGEKQVEISHWFGELDCPFYKHPSSPHPEVRASVSWPSYIKGLFCTVVENPSLVTASTLITPIVYSYDNCCVLNIDKIASYWNL